MISAMVLAGAVWAFGDGSPVDLAYRDYIAEVGVYAVMVGECERHYSSSDTDKAVADLLAAPEHDTKATRALRSLYAQSYAAGRARAASDDLSLEACNGLLADSRRKMKAARARFDKLAGEKP